MSAPEDEQSGSQQRLLLWLNKAKETSLPFALLAFAAFIIGSVVVVVAGFAAVSSWVGDATRDDKAEAIELLESLHPGLPVETFESQLGSPISRWKPEGTDLLETIWAGDDYYVQTISDEVGTVRFYAVTSCAEDFGPFGLQGESLASFGMTPWAWFISGATSESYIFDWQSPGNPTDYQESYVGWNDACDYQEADGCDLFPDIFGIQVTAGASDPSFAEDREIVRSCIIPNTWAQTTPFALDIPLLDDCRGTDDGHVCFTIGPSRITVRTLPGPAGIPD